MFHLFEARRWAKMQLRHVPLLTLAKPRKVWSVQAFNQLQDELLAIHAPISMQVFLTLSLLCFTVGCYLGWIWLYTFRSTLMFGLIAVLLPYLIVRLRLIQVQMRMRLAFLPAIETFYQAYVSVPRRNIRVVLAKLMKEQRLPKVFMPLFYELHEQLVFGDTLALERFANSFKLDWGHTFVQFLDVGLTEGAVLDDALQGFLVDLREAQKAAIEDRNRLLEIRLANFSPALIVLLFIGVNLYFNHDAAVKSYFYDLHGRQLLLQSGLLITSSFAMGIWISLQKT
jgi:hypothetical protein